MFKTVALAALLLIIFALVNAQITNDALWKKYNHEITGILARHYCSSRNQAYPCTALDTTTFQIASTPIDALWHTNPADVCEL